VIAKIFLTTSLSFEFLRIDNFAVFELFSRDKFWHTVSLELSQDLDYKNFAILQLLIAFGFDHVHDFLLNTAAKCE
jgi:hypothetical protein